MSDELEVMSVEQSAEIQAAVTRSEELIQWIDHSINGLDIPSDDRSCLGAGCIDVALEHEKAIIVLVARSLFAPALALMRLTFEAYVRGMWLLHCASDQELKEFQRDKLDRTFNSLIEDLEKLDAYSSKVLSAAKASSWKALNSFTHTGFLQAVRRITPKQIAPRYRESEILRTIGFADAIGIMCTIEIAGMASNNALAQSALEKSRQVAR